MNYLINRSLSEAVRKFLLSVPRSAACFTEGTSEYDSSTRSTREAKKEKKRNSHSSRLQESDNFITSNHQFTSPIAVEMSTNYNQLFHSLSKQKQNYFCENSISKIVNLVSDFQKHPKKKLEPNVLQKNPEFTKLCLRISEVASTIENVEILVDCLKTFHFCKVSPQSEAFKTVFREIRQRSFDFSLNTVVYMNHLLKDYQDPTVQSFVLNDLPKIFRIQLEDNLDKMDAFNLCRYFDYAVKLKLPPTSLELLADRIITDVDETNVTKLLRSIVLLAETLDIDNEEKLKPYIESFSDKFTDIVSYCSTEYLEPISSILGSLVATHRSIVYRQDMFEKLADRVIKEKWSFQESYLVAEIFGKFGFVNYAFMDYFSLITVETGFFANLEKWCFPLHVFAMADYKPANFDALASVALENYLMIEKKFPKPYTHLVLDWAVFGMYPNIMMHWLFEKLADDKARASLNKLDWVLVDKLQRSLRIECPKYLGNLPSFEQLNHARKLYKQFQPTDLSIKEALQTGLGGSSYVSSGLFTKLGHYIDHMLVLRPGGYPIAFNREESGSDDEVQYVEDVPNTEGNQIILIKVWHPECYLVNEDRLRGPFALDRRTLETLKFDVVHINQKRWSELLERQRIPFLMQEIRDKEKKSE